MKSYKNRHPHAKLIAESVCQMDKKIYGIYVNVVGDIHAYEAELKAVIDDSGGKYLFYLENTDLIED